MLNRRSFLCRAAGATFGAPLLLSTLEMRAALAAGNATLVTILQAGGCDGLNTIVPLKQYGTYYDKRHRASASAGNDVALPLASLAATAFDQTPATAPTAASQYAFHPAMGALRNLYGGGRLAILGGVGMPQQETNRLSHEAGVFDWESGTINQLGYSTNGWLGIGMDKAPRGTLPAMISMSGAQPTLMQGKSATPLVLAPPLESFALQISSPDGGDAAARLSRFADIQAQTTSGAAGAFAQSVASEAASLISKVQAAGLAASGNDYPAANSFLSLQLREIARVILSNSGTRAFYAVQGGYDTHSEQQLTHSSLVGDLSDSVAAFYTYLRQRGVSGNVVIMTYTDFGRRVESNNDLGTDHGTASVNFVLGDRVRGGFYGQYPDLRKLDDDGNMAVLLDFRNQLADVMNFMSIDPRPILGQNYAPLGML